MKHPIVTKLISGILNMLACYISLKFVLEGKQTGTPIEAFAFFYWSIPLAVSLTFGGSSIVNLLRGRSIMFRLLLIVVSSIGLSMIWQYAVTQLLGPMGGKLDDSIVYTWGIAALIQLLFLEWRLPKPTTKKEPTMVILGLISIPLTAVLAILTLSLTQFAGNYYNRPEAETYLIPNDFKGEFRVVYGEKNGQNPPMENGRRLLKVPANGVLVIQPEFKDGKVDQQFFLVDRKGKRTAISTIVQYKDRLKMAPGVLYWGVGGTIPNGKDPKASAFYTDFTLYRKDSKERNQEEYNQFQHQFDSLTLATVDKVRGT